ncbi:hypothetical protein CSB09_01470 [Candidatus Gracilibacteria bacterium]|nr:MAG: hypothetical protein CSB09_01470 [Candidatus Gracilibacteria bacterium]
MGIRDTIGSHTDASEYLPKSVREKTDLNADTKLLMGTRGVITDQTRYMYDKTDGVYYSISKFQYFTSKQDLTLKHLQDQGHNPKDVILYFENNKYHYILLNDCERMPLTSKEVLDTMSNKELILEMLYEDSRRDDSHLNIDKTLRKVQNTTENIIKGLETPEEKISAIYDYVLKNSRYIDPIPKNDNRIYSGLEMFARGTGVCEGYTKLFVYMLSAAGITDVEYKSGHILEMTKGDDPTIGHAWVAIGDKYYDPTWDDPTFSGKKTQKDREFSDYEYFGLPRDIMYANRIDRSKENDAKAIKFKKTTSKQKQKDLIKARLYDLVGKYPKGKYKLLEEAEFRREHGIDATSPFTVKNLKKIFPLKTSNDFISQGNYYTIDSKGLNFNILQQAKQEKRVLFLDKKSRKYRLTQKVLPLISPEYLQKQGMKLYTSQDFMALGEYWTLSGNEKNIRYFSSEKGKKKIEENNYVLFYDAKSGEYMITEKIMPLLQEKDIINAFGTVYSSYDYGYKNGYTFTNNQKVINYINRKGLHFLKREGYILFLDEDTKEYAIVKKENLIQ